MTLRILLPALLVFLGLACTDNAPGEKTGEDGDQVGEDGDVSNPDGDSPLADGDSTDDETPTDSLVLYGTGGQEGNPAIVRMGISVRFLTNPDAYVRWESLRLRVTGLNFAEEAQSEADTRLDIVGVAEFELAQANNIRIEARIPSETNYRALAVALDDALPAFHAFGTLADGRTISLDIPLDGIGFWPTESPLSLSPNSRHFWTVTLDADKLVTEGLVEQWSRKSGNIVINGTENGKWVPLLQANLHSAFAVYTDANQNGLLDRSEDTPEGRLASSMPEQSGQIACESAANCASEERCYYGICLPGLQDDTCRRDEDCPADQACNLENGQCETLVSPWTTCSTSDDCPEDALCIYGICLGQILCGEGEPPCPTGLFCDETFRLCLPGPQESVCCDGRDNDHDGIIDEGCICEDLCGDHRDCAPPLSLCLDGHCTDNPIGCLNDEDCSQGCHCASISGIPPEFGKMCLFDLLDLPCLP